MTCPKSMSSRRRIIRLNHPCHCFSLIKLCQSKGEQDRVEEVTGELEDVEEFQEAREVMTEEDEDSSKSTTARKRLILLLKSMVVLELRGLFIGSCWMHV